MVGGALASAEARTSTDRLFYSTKTHDALSFNCDTTERLDSIYSENEALGSASLTDCHEKRVALIPSFRIRFPSKQNDVTGASALVASHTSPSAAPAATQCSSMTSQTIPSEVIRVPAFKAQVTGSSRGGSGSRTRHTDARLYWHTQAVIPDHRSCACQNLVQLKRTHARPSPQ
ncbi:hypothetical protein E2C01_037956 [Portunus trituberculatus]|uniref:Uncharacterized protein n=1 Tax=Portunus trituberculatus TaxID=210409 RepID=A0A5B7FIK7_PORTR|nr:hypothetical protein [Portunus trituberculatus]